MSHSSTLTSFVRNPPDHCERLSWQGSKIGRSIGRGDPLVHYDYLLPSFQYLPLISFLVFLPTSDFLAAGYQLALSTPAGISCLQV